LVAIEIRILENLNFHVKRDLFKVFPGILKNILEIKYGAA